MGLSKSSSQKWAQSLPTAPALKKLAEYFEVSTDYLLGVEQKNPATENGNGISEKKAGLIKKVMQMSDDELEKLEMLLRIVESK
jgi:transcriptional regulator with XRE-family HTH domain